MESIIVELTLGATGDTLEFMLPAHVPLDSFLEDIALPIEQQYPHISFDKASIVLFDLDKQTVLTSSWTLSQNGLRDSSRLLMV